jgi:xanthine/CO dehydrogenase XdhC/CoxF family maturation factor
MGLGCNGIIQVLIEPINALDPNNPVQLLKVVASRRQQHVLITLFSPENKLDAQHGTCLLISEDGNVCGHAPILKEILMKDATSAFESGNSSFKKYNTKDNSQVAFIEVIKPSVSVIIFGAGNDAIPLVKMADVLGWETIVVDGRPDYARKDRFITACQVLVSKPESVLDKVIIDDQTVFLLLTHNYNYDLAMLRTLLKKQVTYIGCLGPRSKLDRMTEELRDEGVALTDEQISRLYGPAGLDIGAETSEEIALSILAEIKTVLSLKDGQPLRTNAGTIHSRAALQIERVDIQK